MPRKKSRVERIPENLFQEAENISKKNNIKRSKAYDVIFNLYKDTRIKSKNPEKIRIIRDLEF